MLQLQEAEDRQAPAATTWAAEFLLRVGESMEFLGLWIKSGAIHEAKRRRATQVITCSFPYGKWLQMIGARASPQSELCRRERRHEQAAIEHLPEETVAHIQSVRSHTLPRRAGGVSGGDAHRRRGGFATVFRWSRVMRFYYSTSWFIGALSVSGDKNT